VPQGEVRKQCKYDMGKIYKLAGNCLDGRPRFVKRSFDEDKRRRLAAIDPDFA